MINQQRVEIVFVNPLQLMEVSAPLKGFAFLTIIHQRFTITVEGDRVMYTLPVDHAVNMQVSYTDAKGNPATIDGEVEWTSSDDALIEVEVDETDSTKCKAMPVGPLGQVQVTATVDADLGDGVRNLITTCDIQIVGGEAVAGSIQPVGEPEQLP
jgi:hypothetical protein